MSYEGTLSCMHISKAYSFWLGMNPFEWIFQKPIVSGLAWTHMYENINNMQFLAHKYGKPIVFNLACILSSLYIHKYQKPIAFDYAFTVTYMYQKPIVSNLAYCWLECKTSLCMLSLNKMTHVFLTKIQHDFCPVYIQFLNARRLMRNMNTVHMYVLTRESQVETLHGTAHKSSCTCTPRHTSRHGLGWRFTWDILDLRKTAHEIFLILNKNTTCLQASDMYMYIQSTVWKYETPIVFDLVCVQHVYALVKCLYFALYVCNLCQHTETNICDSSMQLWLKRPMVVW
jgi:hypothetical protein